MRIMSAVAAGLLLSSCGGTFPNQVSSTSGAHLKPMTTGTPVATLQPTSLSFGYVVIGRTSAPQYVTLTDTGTRSLSISSITVSTHFTQSNNCGTSLSVSAKCTITVYFRPSAYGSVSGTLKVYDNAAGSPQQVSLSGFGTCTRQGGQCAASLPPCCPGLRCVPFSTRAYCEPATAGTQYRLPENAGAVAVIDRAKKLLLRRIVVGAGARSLAITPDGSKIYIANDREHAVSVIDTATNAIVKTIALGFHNHPSDIAVASNGLTSYVTDSSAGTITLIDTARDSVTSTIPEKMLPITLATLPRCSPGVVGSVDGSISYVLAAL